MHQQYREHSGAGCGECELGVKRNSSIVTRCSARQRNLSVRGIITGFDDAASRQRRPVPEISCFRGKVLNPARATGRG
jgi:hypothetical protein